MGLLKKLLGIGVTAGAAVAAVKVVDKYKANNPEGVRDVNGDGKVDAGDAIEQVKKAATEVYGETKVKVGAAVNNAKEQAPETIEKIKEAAAEQLDKLRQGKGGDDGADQQ